MGVMADTVCCACLVQNGSVTQLVQLIDKARIPTAQRVLTLEDENDALRKQLAHAQRSRPSRKANSTSETSKEDTDDETPQEEAIIGNPVHDYINMLESLVRHICICA